MEGFSEIAHGIVTGIYACVCDFFNHRKAMNIRNEILRDRLLNKGYKWRSLKQLARSIGKTNEATTDLLIEMGAHRSAREKDVWTLEK